MHRRSPFQILLLLAAPGMAVAAQVARRGFARACRSDEGVGEADPNQGALRAAVLKAALHPAHEAAGPGSNNRDAARWNARLGRQVPLTRFKWRQEMKQERAAAATTTIVDR